MLEDQDQCISTFKSKSLGTQNAHTNLKKQMSIFGTVVPLKVQKTAQRTLSNVWVFYYYGIVITDSKKDMHLHFSNSLYVENKS